MLTLVQNGDVYAPEHLGEQSILLVDGKIGGSGDRSGFGRGARHRRGRDRCELLLRLPGLRRSHEHLLGGSGEEWFATQTPEIHLSEIVYAGITTVVGTVGVDTCPPQGRRHALLRRSR